VLVYAVSVITDGFREFGEFAVVSLEWFGIGFPGEVVKLQERQTLQARTVFHSIRFMHAMEFQETQLFLSPYNNIIL